jgi:hypothetical protein
MEIVYDGTGTRVLLRKDDGSEVDLLKLEGALTLAQKSREHNRGRVVVLEDRLERIRKILAEDGGLSERLYTAAEVGDLQASEAELVAAPLRRRVADLETELERYRKAHVCTDSCKPNAHVAFTGSQIVKELETELANERQEIERLERENEEYHLNRIKKLETKVREYDKDRHTERDRADQNKAWAERAEANGSRLSAALVQAEKDRDSARRRVAELEAQLSRSIDRENKLEADAAEEKTIHSQSIAARDHLLEAATRRISLAREALDRPMVVGARNEIVTSKGAILADAIAEALRVLDA